MQRSFLLALALVLVVPALASAVTVYQNGMTFDVRVQNRHFREIRDARVNVWISGSQARISATAAGYRDGNGYVYLREGTTHYSTQIRLDDPSVSCRVEDALGQPIPGVSIRENNFAAWADEYRFEIRMAAEGFRKFGRNDVDLRVNYLFPFMETVWVRDLGESRLIEITLKRRDLDRMFNNVSVAVPSDAQLESHRRDLKRAILDFVQKNELSDERRESLLKRVGAR